MGGEKPLLGTPSSLTAVPYPALPPHPFLRLVLRLFPDFTLLSFVWTVPLQSHPPTHIHTQPGPNLYLYKSCKYVKFYPCALFLAFPTSDPTPGPPFLLSLAVVIIWGLYCTYWGCVCVGWGQPLCTELPGPLPPHASLPLHHPKGRERLFLPVLFCFLVLPPHPVPPHSQPSLSSTIIPFSPLPAPFPFFLECVVKQKNHV